MSLTTLPGAAVVGACLVLQLGCSGNTNTGAPPSHLAPRSASTKPTSLARAVGLEPPDWTLFPEEDTPVGSAPPAMATAWSSYGVSVIPGRHILDAVPATPRVRNLTSGAVSDADAQLWASAEMRTEAYVGWMEANGQANFNHNLRSDAFLAGPIGQALRAHELVTNPPCDLYPTAIALVPVDPSLQAFFGSRGLRSSAAYALVMTYAPGPGGCAVTALATPGPTPGPTPAAHLLFSVPPQGGTEIEGGMLRNDPLLGQVWVSDSAGECRPGEMPAACEANG